MLTRLSKNSLYQLTHSVLWFLVLVGLPLTSFPLLSRLTRRDRRAFLIYPPGRAACVLVGAFRVGTGQVLG